MKYSFLSLLLLITTASLLAQPKTRQSFNDNWKFYLGDQTEAAQPSFADASWRSLNLPHDWSIELPFDKTSPTGTGGGALRGGIGWYRKTFMVPASAAGKYISITFDGAYRNSEVWINGTSLGKRPNGYISFQYDLTPYLKPGAKNVIAVRVDNSDQPNSRWYSGSGIYRNTWLTITDKTHIGYNGTFFSTPDVSSKLATIKGAITIDNTAGAGKTINLETRIVDATGKTVSTVSGTVTIAAGESKTIDQQLQVTNPVLWSLNRPYLYKAINTIKENGKLLDEYQTSIGIRSFVFDVDKGFILNGKHEKIRGVCDHHDLGCLGTAINHRALQRQLELLKGMGCNAIRTSHNPPAPELLDLADEMGFVIMDEAFDMWKREKTKYDYHLYWDEWHKKDLEDQIIRDRNHPSVFIWSVGNEIGEQWTKDEEAPQVKAMVRDLVNIVKGLDKSRPTVTANNDIAASNRILQSQELDMIGYNYNHTQWTSDSVFKRWGRKPFIITESVSALQTRGHYDMPSDSIRRWPVRWDKPLTTGNPDTTCSAYDNCSAPWGSTHEETMKVFEKYDHISGMFIWTGFDYIGEPTPYEWPARSSYFGIIDLAGFPKDVYYMYQSVWTNKPVLHILPHWNSPAGVSTGDPVDVWVYYNNADEVELFVNGKSAGIKKKTGDDLHIMWRVPYVPGVVKAVSRKNGKIVLTKEIKTAGAAAKIILQADRRSISGPDDLAFVTVKITDKDGNMVPDAANLVQFTVTGGSIAGVDNGSETSMESFKDDKRKAFNGLCLAVVRSDRKSPVITLKATAQGLTAATVTITAK